MVSAILLLTQLTPPVAKFLAKNYLKLPEPLSDMAEKLTDIVAERIPDAFQREDTEEQFKRLSRSVVQRLQSLFDEESQNSNINVEAVIFELQQTLSSRVDNAFFLERNLNPAQLALAFRLSRPLSAGILGEPEVALYERALDETIRYLVAVVVKLTCSPSSPHSKVESEA